MSLVYKLAQLFIFVNARRARRDDPVPPFSPLSPLSLVRMEACNK